MTKYRYRKKKRGVASVLGILLMVGILITSILPTFIYVNEVNNYYDRTVVVMKIEDNDRSMENLEVYAYGHNETSVDVFIVNRSPLATNISRIWVLKNTLQDAWIFNSTNRPDLPLFLGASEQITLRLDFTDINEPGNSYNIEVTTERGNKFSSTTNPLTYTQDEQWQTGTTEFQIQVIIQSNQGQDRYLIQIFGPESHYDFVDSTTVQGMFFSIFSVPQAGQYNITVHNIKSGSYLVGNMTRILTWIYPSTYCQFDDT